MVDRARNLNQFQTTHILTVENRTAGFTKKVKMLIEGNSLLSSVYVRSVTGSPTLDVNYYEITTGIDGEERRDLTEEHPILTAASTRPDTRLVTPFHNNLVCEIIVGGTGSIEFGIYVTVVASFASLLDEALKNHLEAVDLSIHQGLPLAVRDPNDGKWYLLEGDQGRLTISTIPSNADLLQTSIESVTTPGIEQTLASETVGAGKTRYLHNLKISCRLPAVYKIYADGDTIGSGRTGPGTPNDRFIWEPFYKVTEGITIELKLTAMANLPATDVEAFISAHEI